LTVTSFDETSFKVGVAPETLRRTNLGSLKHRSNVNLERAVSATTRMGGHFVQGHVDTVATILKIEPDGNALTFRFQPRDKSVLRYIVETGYVTLDDTESWWEVMLISYTQEKVVTASKEPGDEVNVEVDQIGKYVEKAVEGYFSQGTSGQPAILQNMVERIVDARLNSGN
jgi:riboflavin synthase